MIDLVVAGAELAHYSLGMRITIPTFPIYVVLKEAFASAAMHVTAPQILHLYDASQP